MSKLKIIIAALILGLGLVGAYFIIANYDAKPAQPKENQEAAGNNPVGITIVGSENSEVKNLTELLTQKIEDRVLEQNTEGTLSLNGQTLISAPDPKQLTEDLILEAQKNFDAEKLKGIVEEFRFKISEDTSKNAITKYFDSFSQIMIDGNKDAPTSIDQPETMTPADFTKIEKMYEIAANKFYDLSVPKTLTEIHKKEIKLLLTKKNIYGTIAKLDSDPMTALLALNELLLTDQEFATLKTEIENFLKTM